ncbi:hypothetical protein F3Y22_tig00113123pilonHSYRG00263 [Hibiscus syriacus]|uniref:Uncharacterized protein n=1 Tax=Hibiscus syriacus TaxID=106335 RepID=A0A6A2WQH3_HIBSY|nr:hypothetical protein F3Y22_tig00113123pilonHSYRG00263 [Hibiscus syriacus]
MSPGNCLPLRKMQKTQNEIGLSQAMLLMACSPCYNLHNPCTVKSPVLVFRVASGLALGGTVRFHSEAKTMADIIIDRASETIYNTTGAMKEMRDSLADTDATGQASTFLTTTSRRLDVEADDIARQARRNRRLIERGLEIV